MARKRTKGKTTKKVTRKKVTKRTGAKRRTARAAKKPRKSASTVASAKAVVEKTLESTGALNLLRAWSPSRYSTR